MADENKYDEIEHFVEVFQEASRKIKYATVPVVSAIHGMVLGGGHEMMLHCHKTVLHHETYRGFVEAGVGILPAGAGFVEMLKRTQHDLEKYKYSDLLPRDRFIWETLSMAKVSKNAYDTANLGFLSDDDIIVASKDNQLEVAKQAAINLIESGFIPNVPEMLKVTGTTGFAALQYIGQAMMEGHFISEYDYEIAMRIAKILTGGDVPKNTYVTEEEILKLERDNIMVLLHNEKTQARMRHMLEKNKPLRN